jgi:hypothetical protein
MNVNGDMNVLPPTAAYRAMKVYYGMLLDIPPCPMPRETVMKVKHNYFYPTRLQNPLIKSEVAVGFIRC